MPTICTVRHHYKQSNCHTFWGQREPPLYLNHLHRILRGAFLVKTGNRVQLRFFIQKWASSVILSCLTDRFACDLLFCRSQERRHTLDTVRQGGFRPTDRPPSGQPERTAVDKVSGSSCCRKIKPQLLRNCKLCWPPYLDFGRLIKLCKICEYRGCLFGFIFNLTHA